VALCRAFLVEGDPVPHLDQACQQVGAVVRDADVSGDRADAVVFERTHDLADPVGIDDRVGVDRHHELTPAVTEGGVLGEPLATVSLRKQHRPACSSSEFGVHGQQLGPIGGAVVDHIDPGHAWVVLACE
jgi:hypothetical protein